MQRQEMLTRLDAYIVNADIECRRAWNADNTVENNLWRNRKWTALDARGVLVGGLSADTVLANLLRENDSRDEEAAKHLAAFLTA